MELKYVIIAISIVFLLFVVLGLAIVNYSFEEMYEKYKMYSHISTGITPFGFASLINSIHFENSIKIKYNDKLFSDAFSAAGVLTLCSQYAESDNLAGLAICAHEMGHAFQYALQGKKMRRFAKNAKITNFLSYLISPFMIFGILSLIFINIYVGGSFIALSVVFLLCVVLVKFSCLKLEKQASKKAIELLRTHADLDDAKLKDAKKFLASAKQTYVAEILRVVLKWTGLVRK